MSEQGKFLKRVGVLAGALVAVLACTILFYELREPSPEYWWRSCAEVPLRAVAAGLNGRLGLSSAKLAFKLRQHASADETVSQLARAAAREGDSSLSSVSRLYLARRSLPYIRFDENEDYFLLAKKAFQERGNELTAWQYASLLARTRKEVPADVVSVLENGVGWEYSSLWKIDTTPGAVARSVLSNIDGVRDSELHMLLESACEAEGDLAFWSDAGNRSKKARELKQLLSEIEPLANEDRLGSFGGNFIESFLERALGGLSDIFSGEDPIASGASLTKIGRRFLTVVDALGAINSAGSYDQKIVKARELRERLNMQISSLESGGIVSALEGALSRSRTKLADRVVRLLSDPRRYQVRDSLVLAAIDGRDANLEFLRNVSDNGGHTMKTDSSYFEPLFPEYDFSSCGPPS